jgi:membrane protein
MVDILLQTYRGWRDHRVVRLGAGMAYYGLFALVPMVTVLVVVADLLVSYDAAVAYVATPLAELLGEDVDEVAATLSERIGDAGGMSGLGILGGVTLLLSASLLFVAFQDALNLIWEVPYEAGLRRSIRRRLLGFAIVLLASAAVLVSLAVQTVVGWLRDALPSSLEAVASSTQLISRLAPIAVTAIALALLYALLAPAGVSLRAAAAAGSSTALSLTVGVVATGWVLERTASASAQGAAGVVLVLLTGFYVESQIVLVGGELTRVLTLRWGDEPLEGAVHRVRWGHVGRRADHG